MLDTIFNKSGCNLQLQVNEKKNKMRKHVRKPKKQQQVNRKIRKERKKKRPSASTSYSSGQRTEDADETKCHTPLLQLPPTKLKSSTLGRPKGSERASVTLKKKCRNIEACI